MTNNTDSPKDRLDVDVLYNFAANKLMQIAASSVATDENRLHALNALISIAATRGRDEKEK
jgi:hypothetical protein